MTLLITATKIELTVIMIFKTTNSQIGIFSDPHYGVHRNSETWHKIAIEHAKWTAEQFKTRGISDIVIPGDIFHDRNDVAVNTLHVATDIFSIFSDFNIVITTGNHDSFFRDNSSVNSISILKGWSNITTVDKLLVVDFQDKKIAFCPWGQDINEVPKCDLIIGHFEINSFRMNSTKVCMTGIKPSELTSKAKLTISGHFHQREERKYEDGTILYVGDPYQMDWSDYNTNKGLYILDLEDLSYEFIENTVSPRYVKVRYSDIADGKYTAETLKSSITRNIVKFIIDRQLDPIAVDSIVRKLVSISPTEFTIDYDYSELVKFDNETAAEKDFSVSTENSISEFVDLLEIKNKDKVKTYVLDIYHRAVKV